MSKKKRPTARQDGPAHVREKLQVGPSMVQDGARREPEGPTEAQDGPSWPQGEAGRGKMGTKKGQEGAREAQVGPKMA